MGCFHDASSATYLDDVLMQDPHTGATDQAHNGRTPLSNVHLIGTESTPSKIYRIVYTIPWDDLLSESSKLHKALVAKYGEPTEIHGWMRWKIDTTELKVRCESTDCTIDVEDRKFTAAGPFSLQYAIGANNTPGGAIKWRNLMVKPL